MSVLPRRCGPLGKLSCRRVTLIIAGIFVLLLLAFYHIYPSNPDLSIKERLTLLDLDVVTEQMVSRRQEFNGGNPNFAADSATSYKQRLLKVIEGPINHWTIPYAFKHTWGRFTRLNEIEVAAQRFNALPIRNQEKFPQTYRSVMNGEKYIDGRPITPILILVNKRPHYLRRTVQKYKEMVDVETTMLIISHDGFYKEVADIIDSIDFCLVKELMFPYSFNLLDELPSESPGHALQRVGYEMRLNIPGGMKLHWIWALSNTWEVVGRDPITRAPLFDELCYMEDDYWVAPDFYVALQATNMARDKSCPECMGSVVGEHSLLGTQGIQRHLNLANTTHYDCDHRSLCGWSLGRHAWTQFHIHVDEYCEVRDDHWDEPIRKMWTSYEWGTSNSRFQHQRLDGDGVFNENPANGDVFDKGQTLLAGVKIRPDRTGRTMEPLFLRLLVPRAEHIGHCWGMHYSQPMCESESIDGVLDITEKTFQEDVVTSSYSRAQSAVIPRLHVPDDLIKETTKVRCHEKFSVQKKGFRYKSPADYGPLYRRSCNFMAQAFVADVGQSGERINNVPMLPMKRGRGVTTDMEPYLTWTALSALDANYFFYYYPHRYRQLGPWLQSVVCVVVFVAGLVLLVAAWKCCVRSRFRRWRERRRSR